MTLFNLHLQRLLWIYCTGNPGVKGNDRADRLADKQTITEWQAHEMTPSDHQEKTDTEKAWDWRSTWKGWDGAIATQTNNEPVSKATPEEKKSAMGWSAYGLSLSHQISLTVLNRCCFQCMLLRTKKSLVLTWVWRRASHSQGLGHCRKGLL